MTPSPKPIEKEWFEERLEQWQTGEGDRMPMRDFVSDLLAEQRRRTIEGVEEMVKQVCEDTYIEPQGSILRRLHTLKQQTK